MYKEAALKVMGAFERSKWLREGAIYLELLLCFALESWQLEMASSRYGTVSARLALVSLRLI